MSFYYCINDVLDRLDSLKDEENRFQTLIPVNTQTPDCCAHPDDAFILASAPKMLDLTMAENAYQLKHLIDHVPLYNINIELVMDQALTERHHNTKIEKALTYAFDNQPLPNTLHSSHQEGDENFSGDLHHPMIEHLDKEELCRIYMAFLEYLGRDYDHYNFEKNILGKHVQSFLEHFDGYITPHHGKVKALILIAFGMRCDHDPGKPMETHVENGKKIARKMNITDPHEMIWAWLEADSYQQRRCRDLDRIMRLEGLPKIPNWVRTDIFSCLEREAMKQIFAENLLLSAPDFPLLQKTKYLAQALKTNAQGHVDEILQQLLAQTLNQSASYIDAAARFAENAEKRTKEAKAIKLN